MKTLAALILALASCAHAQTTQPVKVEVYREGQPPAVIPGPDVVGVRWTYPDGTGEGRVWPSTRPTTLPATVPATQPATQPAPAGTVVKVGSTRPVNLLADGISRVSLTAGRVELDPGQYKTGGIRVTALKPLVVAGPASIIGTSTGDYDATIEHRGKALTLKDLTIAAPPDRGECVRGKGFGLVLDNVTPTSGSFRFLRETGDDTTVRNCRLPKLLSYSLCNFDSDSHGLRIDNCTFSGAGPDGHAVRLQRIYGLRASNSDFIASGARSALSIRDGGDNEVRGCTIKGRIYIGPLADGDGGINDSVKTAADRLKRDAKLRRTQKGVRFIDCDIETDGITVEMGSQNVVFEDCRIKTSKPYVFTLNDDAYRPWRNVPTGTVRDCLITGPAGTRVFRTARPGFGVEGATSVNGQRVAG